MMKIMRYTPIHHSQLIFVAITTFFMILPTYAGSDHDRARSALMRGEIMALKTLLERLELTFPGQVLELELERDGNRWRYEVKILQSQGKLLKLEIDATNGEVLRQRERTINKKP